MVGLIQEGRGWTRCGAEVFRVIAARGSDHVDTMELVQVCVTDTYILINRAYFCRGAPAHRILMKT